MTTRGAQSLALEKAKRYYFSFGLSTTPLDEKANFSILLHDSSTAWHETVWPIFADYTMARLAYTHASIEGVTFALVAHRTTLTGKQLLRALGTMPHLVLSGESDCFVPAHTSLATIRAERGADIGLVAIEIADDVLCALQEQNVVPKRVMTTRDNEIAFYFYGRERTAGGAHRRYATIVCDSDGDITALIDDRISDARHVWEVPRSELSGSLDEIAAFIED